jgi:hypothetical protein
MQNWNRLMEVLSSVKTLKIMKMRSILPLGTAFQSYLDAIEIIETSNFSEDFKDVEKSKVLEARKQAFGSEFEYYPPWKLR